MGHAKISVTRDRYAHPTPGNEGVAEGPLDAHLARAGTKARLAHFASQSGRP